MNSVQENQHPQVSASIPRATWLLVTFVALLVTGLVASGAWVSEDSFFTFRYVANTLAGHGIVFNVGDYTQGYTHPLWFLLLLVGSFLFSDPVLVAIGYGLLFTFFTVLIYGLTLQRLSADALSGGLLLLLGAGVFAVTDSWLSFQTGGLENALSHLLLCLVICDVAIHQLRKPNRLILLLTLLCMSRPDFFWFTLPIGLVAARRSVAEGGLAKLAAAMLPGLAWLLFASSYYGYPLPNTGSAKLGVFSSLGAAIQQGLNYLLDWFVYDTTAVVATFMLLLLTALLRKDLPGRLLLAGLVLQLCWVIATGGDFMRGRFFVAIMTGGVILGTLSLATYLAAANYSSRKIVSGMLAVLMVITVAGAQLRPALPEVYDFDNLTIVNERHFYPGYSLRSYLDKGYPFTDANMVDNVQMLRNYIAACGPVAVHWRNPATMGYLVGPELTIIDTLGLVDSYIARLPAALLVDSNPRPGHADRYIPVQYLSKRGDVALVPDWVERLRQQDCTLKAEAGWLKDSDLYITPDNEIVELSFSN